MAYTKIALVAFCCTAAQMPLAAVVEDSSENCSALPSDNVHEGQRALLQHSELNRVVASASIQMRRAVDDFTLTGSGQCTDEDGKTEYFQLGWAPCTCNKPLGNICTAGTCPDVNTCAAECDAVSDCVAFNWLPGHCWLYGSMSKPYTKHNAEFAHFQCYVRTQPTTTPAPVFSGMWVIGAENQHCSNACNAQGGKVCDEDELQAPTTQEATNAIATPLNFGCTSYRDLQAPYSPAVSQVSAAGAGVQNTCVWTLSKTTPRNCGSVPDFPYRRLCPCV